jgi:hypothetical protein
MPDTPAEDTQANDAQADGYYDDDMGADEELDLSFLDQDDEQAKKK